MLERRNARNVYIVGVSHSLSNSSVLPVRVTWDVEGANIHVRLTVGSCAFT